jgi:hypothetical protein
MNQHLITGLLLSFFLLGCSSKSGSTNGGGGSLGSGGALMGMDGSSPGVGGAAGTGADGPVAGLGGTPVDGPVTWLGGAVTIGADGPGVAVAAGPVAVTPPGEVRGKPVQVMIPAAGGILISPDGILTIEVPAGALASAQTLTIQPITNQAPGGLGAAYRLGPEGQTFAVPVTLTFTYTLRRPSSGMRPSTPTLRPRES